MEQKVLGIGRDIIEEYPEFSSWFLPWAVLSHHTRKASELQE